MRAILKYIIRLIFLAAPLFAGAQDVLERQIFIRPGLDLSRFVLPFAKDYGLSGLEASLDAEIKYRYFPTIEAGYNKVNDKTALHEYSSYGNYFRLGFNYNMLNYKHRLDRSLFFVGARYGLTNFSHQADKINITNGYGTLETSFPNTQLNAQWFEGVIGLRGEFFKNFFMGYTIRVKFMIKHSDYENYTPYWVPGFGEGVKSTAIGMSYSIFYAIPIKKFKLDFEE